MADETPEEKPARRRRRKSADESAPEAATPQSGTESQATAARAASDADPSADELVDEIEPTPADEEAEQEAADVVLEAEDEIDEDTEAEGAAEAEPEAEKPARRPRRRRAPAESAAAEPEAPKPAPARRRRAQRDPSLPPPVVRAQAKYVRSSPRKARLVCDHIRGKSVDEARAILAHTPRAVARDWSKLLESAIANAENNHELVGEDLYVKAVHADDGPTIKRFRPRALGRATKIRKRTSHLTILLTPKE
jgi:large subunit ribosomal protein L22